MKPHRFDCVRTRHATPAALNILCAHLAKFPVKEFFFLLPFQARITLLDRDAPSIPSPDKNRMARLTL